MSEYVVDDGVLGTWIITGITLRLLQMVVVELELLFDLLPLR